MDTPIMLLFFNRPETLKEVFEAVREAKPRQLFLVQDGPRSDHPDDDEKIMKCREIVSYVDWPCEVRRNFSDENLTCDHREYTGVSWCFQYVDRLIVLEDDCVPSKSFFGLCEELLEKYKDDERIHSISGFNRVNIYSCEYDYVFSKSGAGLGWATWKRVWEKTDELSDLAFVQNKDFLNWYNENLDDETKSIYGDVVKEGKQYRNRMEKTKRVPSWEYLFGICLMLHDMLVITPSRNMIKYIGVSEDATHCVANPKLLPHKVRKVLMQSSYNIMFPIKHPPFIFRDTKFEKLSTESMRYQPYIAKIESVLLKIRYGEWGLLKQAVLKKLKK